jgi:hypothetical protein
MSAGNRTCQRRQGHRSVAVIYESFWRASSTSCRLASIQSCVESPARESWSRRSAIKYARIRISSSDGSWIDAAAGVFFGEAGLLARAVFFESAFLRLGLGAAAIASASISVSRAIACNPLLFAGFTVSIFDFLATSCCLRMSAQSTDEAGVASGFCKPVA